MTEIEELQQDLQQAYETISQLEMQLIEKENQVKQKDEEYQEIIKKMKEDFVNKEISLNSQIIKLKKLSNPTVTSINKQIVVQEQSHPLFKSAQVTEKYGEDAYKATFAAVVHYICDSQELQGSIGSINSKRYDLLKQYQYKKLTMDELLDRLIPITKIVYSPKESFVQCLSNFCRLHGHTEKNTEQSILEYIQQENRINARLDGQKRLFCYRNNDTRVCDTIFICQEADLSKIREFEYLGSILMIGFIKPMTGVTLAMEQVFQCQGETVKGRLSQAVFQDDSSYVIVPNISESSLQQLRTQKLVCLEYSLQK